jgi:hypothetical protein
VFVSTIEHPIGARSVGSRSSSHAAFGCCCLDGRIDTPTPPKPRCRWRSCCEVMIHPVGNFSATSDNTNAVLVFTSSNVNLLIDTSAGGGAPSVSKMGIVRSARALPAAPLFSIPRTPSLIRLTCLTCSTRPASLPLRSCYPRVSVRSLPPALARVPTPPPASLISLIPEDLPRSALLELIHPLDVPRRVPHALILLVYLCASVCVLPRVLFVRLFLA